MLVAVAGNHLCRPVEPDQVHAKPLCGGKLTVAVRIRVGVEYEECLEPLFKCLDRIVLILSYGRKRKPVGSTSKPKQSQSTARLLYTVSNARAKSTEN